MDTGEILDAAAFMDTGMLMDAMGMMDTGSIQHAAELVDAAEDEATEDEAAEDWDAVTSSGAATAASNRPRMQAISTSGVVGDNAMQARRTVATAFHDLPRP